MPHSPFTHATFDRRTAIRQIAAGACASAAALTTASCAPASDPTRRVVRLWTLALSPRFDDYMRAHVLAFEQSHPGVRVQWTDVAYDALDRKLIAAAAAGMAPDVVNMADLNYARFVSLGAFRDIRADLPGDPAATYLPGALSLCTIGGKLLALPWYVNPQTRIINTELLARASYDPLKLPGDWSGIMEVAPRFRSLTQNYLFSQPLGEESQLPIMMLAEGLEPLRARDGGRLAANLSSEPVAAYLDRWVELYRSGSLPREAATKGHAHLLDLYQDGRVAIISTGPNFLNRIRDVSPKVYATTTVQPGAVGALGRVHMPVMVLAVSGQTRLPREAAELAWFMTSASAQTALCKLAPIMPSSMASLQDPFFADVASREKDKTLALGTSVALRTLPQAVAFTASLDTWPNLRRAFEDEFKRVLLDGADLRRSLARIDTAWNELLDAAPPAGLECVPRPSRVETPAAFVSPGGAA